MQSLLEKSAGLGPDVVQVVTPPKPWRGAQLSIRLLTVDALGDNRIDGGSASEAKKGLEAVHAWLGQHGVVCDLRRPDMLRFAPAPLYNTFEESHAFVLLLREALAAVV
jgi:kynureninase